MKNKKLIYKKYSFDRLVGFLENREFCNEMPIAAGICVSLTDKFLNDVVMDFESHVPGPFKGDESAQLQAAKDWMQNFKDMKDVELEAYCKLGKFTEDFTSSFYAGVPEEARRTKQEKSLAGIKEVLGPYFKKKPKKTRDKKYEL